MVGMHETHLHTLDLNLLVALHVLLEEANVTRAAARLGRSQPAVSRMLSRLRETFHDPLLVRDGPRMRATPRAEALRDSLARVLRSIETELLAPEAFDPATAQRAFTLAGADFAESTLLPEALARVAREAPGFDIVLEGPDLHLSELADRIDLLLAPLRAPPVSLRSVELGKEPFAVLVWEDHPATTLDLEAYVAHPHVLVAPRGNPGGLVDDLLDARGLRRRVALRTRSFLSAPRFLVGTDRILTLPRRTAELAATTLPLRIVEPPLPLPAFPLHLAWHERWHQDPAHRWLRRTLGDAIRPLLV
ncbi:MAG: LysR family transcriptional regulator [Alphaproteobacteria bacterium]|nr:LysR family transcriptional regulator [Alphaproteobacteria bacterium]